MSEVNVDAVDTKPWGDIPLILDTTSGIAVLEREQITKPRALPVEGPRLCQPIESSIPNSDQNTFYVFDPYIVHTIKLLQFANKLRALIFQALECSTAEAENLPLSPLMPSFNGPDIKAEKSTSKSFQHSAIFRYHMKKAPPEVSDSYANELSQHSVGTMCAHAGFETATKSVMDFLADLQQEYVKRICKLLRATVDKKASDGFVSFVDVIEKVFHDIGIGSVTSMEEYYQNRVLKYHENTTRICRSLQEDYEKLRNPDNKVQFEDLKTIRIKEEPVMEIEFPTLEEIEEGGDNGNTDNVIQLEELQNLHSIDNESTLKDEEGIKWTLSGQSIKQENLNQVGSSELDLDEEIINVSDSPPSNGMSELDAKDSVFMSSTELGSPRLKTIQAAKRRKVTK